jgi:hypothetical protein
MNTKKLTLVLLLLSFFCYKVNAQKIIAGGEIGRTDTLKVAVVRQGAKSFTMGYLVETYYLISKHYKPIKESSEWKVYNAKWIRLNKYSFCFPCKWNHNSVNSDIPKVSKVYTFDEKRGTF